MNDNIVDISDPFATTSTSSSTTTSASDSTTLTSTSGETTEGAGAELSIATRASSIGAFFSILVAFVLV